MSASNRRQFLFGSAALAGGALVAPAAGALRALGGAPPGPGRAARAQDAGLRARFLAAVVAGRLDEVRGLLAEHRELVDAADAAGCSALVLACREGHAEVQAALLEHGAQVGLIEAVMLPDWERAVELGRADRAALDAWHPVGGTTIYASALAGNDDMYHLQDLGADPDANPRGRHGVTPAYGALECRHPVDALGALVGLLSNGAHVNTPQREGDSLLHAAARRGDPDLVRYLLRRGADADARDLRGRTPLDLAEAAAAGGGATGSADGAGAERGVDAAGRAQTLALLRDPGRVPRDDTSARYALDSSGGAVVWPDLSDVTQEQQSAVTGPSHTSLERVQAALAGEARRSFSRSTQNELAVEASAHVGRREIMRLHLDHGVPQSLCTAVSVGDLPAAKALLARFPRAIHERGPHDFALLWYAALGGAGVEAAELLLGAGVPVDQESMGMTAMHWAARLDERDLAVLLAERGADLDAVGYKMDREGQTPLQAARLAGNDEMVKLLSDLGAS